MTIASTSSANAAATQLQLQQWRNSQSGSSNQDSSDLFAEMAASVQSLQSNMFSSLLTGASGTSSTAGADSLATTTQLQDELTSLLSAASGTQTSDAASQSSGAQGAGGAHHGGHHHHHASASDSSSDSLTATSQQLIDGTDTSESSTSVAGLPQALFDALDGPAPGQTSASAATAT